MGKRATPPVGSPTGRGLCLALAALAGGGLLLSAYLSVLHWQVNNQPGHVSFCAVSESVNCDTVALSRYSWVLGMPISTWGLLFYGLLLVLALWGARSKTEGWPWGLLGLGTLGAAGFSVYLFLLAHLRLGTFCLMCGGLYAVNLALVGVTGFGLRRHAALGPGAFARRVGGDLRFLFSRPGLLGGLLSLAIGVGAGAFLGTRALYPERSIAGGLDGMERGVTESGLAWIGAAEPVVTVTEFSDYECPFCNRAHEVVREVVRENRGWLRLVHLHLPLDQACNPDLPRPFHRTACLCARGAVCAGQQGRFWEMNDRLFLRRGGVDAGGLVALAEVLSLDISAFKACLSSDESARRIQQDLAEAKRLGLKPATPVFLVGSEVVVGMKDRRWWSDTVLRLKEQAQPAPPSPPPR
jgi:uncharacterized membrane protein/predicted DsbA family dithiol-disulfide isomerase